MGARGMATSTRCMATSSTETWNSSYQSLLLPPVSTFQPYLDRVGSSRMKAGGGLSRPVRQENKGQADFPMGSPDSTTASTVVAHRFSGFYHGSHTYLNLCTCYK